MEAVPIRERSNSNSSKCPTLKQYKKYLQNESPPWIITNDHPYHFEEKPSYLKPLEVDNTTLVKSKT